MNRPLKGEGRTAKAEVVTVRSHHLRCADMQAN